MKVGVFTVLLAQRPFEEALDYIKEAGCEAVEIGTRRLPRRRPLQTGGAAGGIRAAGNFQEAVTSPGSGDQRPLLPRQPAPPERGYGQDRRRRSFRDTVRLAAELGVEHGRSPSPAAPATPKARGSRTGSPAPGRPTSSRSSSGSGPRRSRPTGRRRPPSPREHGVRVAIELHPGFVAYHTESFWRLREIGGETIGVNFDPSHLFWQGMDPLVCVRELGDAIYHVHMKDTWLDQPNIAPQRRPRHQAVHRRGQPLLDLPHRRLRPRPGVLAGADQRAAPRRLRRRPLDRARGLAHERQRRLHQGREVPQSTTVGAHRAAGRGVVGVRPTRRSVSEIGVGLVGYKFMGRAHSNAYRQVGALLRRRVPPRMRAICGRDEAAVRVPPRPSAGRGTRPTTAASSRATTSGWSTSPTPATPTTRS